MTTDTVTIPDINLEQHELETITAVMGALNLPMDRKFEHGPYNNDSLTTVQTEFLGTRIEIETRKNREGYFWAVISAEIAGRGRLIDVRIAGRVVGDSIILRGDNKSFVEYVPHEHKKQRQVVYVVSSELDGGEVKVNLLGSENTPENEFPHRLQGITGDTAAPRLFELARTIMYGDR